MSVKIISRGASQSSLLNPLAYVQLSDLSVAAYPRTLQRYKIDLNLQR